MVNISVENFSLKQIAESGQCFRMKERDGYYEVIARDRYLRAWQDKEAGGTVHFDCTEEEYEDFWKAYFDLDRDYGKFIVSVDPADSYLTEACRTGYGIRILNQDLWEMIVSFLISQQNNISRIRKCIDNISRSYGKCCTDKYGETYYAFPEATVLADLEPDALMACNLGYRSKYVVNTAKRVAEGQIDLHELYNMSYEDARTELLSLYGVGVKVADCICLFALHKLEAFPVDTHIKQVLAREYADGFPYERYRDFLGVIQQYIFYRDLIRAK